MATEQWHTIEIAGKPAEIFEPSQARGSVLFLHNARGQSLSVSGVYTSLLQEHRLNCVCPWGGATWWTDCIVPDYDLSRTAERYLLGSIVPFISERWWLAPRSLALLGISMGGQGALRLACKQPELFPVVAAIAPAVDYHEFYGAGSPIDSMYTSKEQCRQDTVPMHIHPTTTPPHIFYCVDPDDEHWHRGVDRLHEKMTALGVIHEFDLTTPAGGHSWTYFEAMAARAIAFVSRGLAIESRRLL